MFVIGGPSGSRRRRHAPAHQDKLAIGAGVAHDWRGIIRKYIGARLLTWRFVTRKRARMASWLMVME
jgi:hypothetical protein